MAKETVGRQMVRSADSIGANIAEGTGRGSFQDNRRFILIARGSLYETKHWLRRAFRRRLLNETQVEDLKALLHQIGPSLNAYLRSVGDVPECRDAAVANRTTRRTSQSPAPNDQGQLTKDCT
jgi:four helix bundle protein